MNDVSSAEAVKCAICRSESASIGLLCESCRDDIVAPVGLLPQQVVATFARSTSDAVIDQWGRAHLLDERTLVGRAIEGTGIMLLEASISRHHAHIARDPDGWRVRDLASANGTFVNDEPVDVALLRHGDRLSLGAVRLFFAPELGAVPATVLDAASVITARSVIRATISDADEDTDVDSPIIAIDEVADAGLPTIDFRIAETGGGGGGVLEIRGVSLALSTNQVRLVALLARRMIAESHQPPFVRGFVRSSELLGSLSWDSPEPDDNHVKQLVRRTRRQLDRAGLGDLIEARQRFGYRLRLIPRE